MAYRCQQSRLRRRYRYDRRPDVHALPQRTERYRADAAVALFNRHPLTPPLLETVAPPKRNTPHPRFCPRHRPRKPNFKGHLRCSSEKGNRRHRMSFLPCWNFCVLTGSRCSEIRQNRPAQHSNSNCGKGFLRGCLLGHFQRLHTWVDSLS